MMIGAAIPVILVLGVIVLVVVLAIQRSMAKGEDKGDGADIIAYLILALAMGVAGFALAALASTAFPGERFVFDPAENLATSLSALVVATPFLIYFWQRQTRRRVIYPNSTGWALYLSLIEIVFLTAFVVSTVSFVNGLLTDGPLSAWTGTLVFGAVVALHEYAARITPPQSDAGELRRVVGSAIGLITATIGVTGVLAAAIAAGLEPLGGTAVDPGFHPWVSMFLVGTPIWWYRWMRPWETGPGVPRLTWEVIVSVAALATALGAATAIGVQTALYLFTATSPAGQHFDTLPATLSLVLVGLPIWIVHRRNLEDEGGSPLRVYQYAMAAIAMVTAVSMAIALTIAALDRSLIVGAEASDIITLAVVLVVGLVVWLVFDRRVTAGEEVVPSWPRKLYTLGVGIGFGLVAAGALIATVFIVLRRILNGTDTGGLIPSVTVFTYTALTAWYLLRGYARDRVVSPAAERIAPFDVTVICSHPGPLATRFPDEARLRVWYRADDAAAITEEMADEIVFTVANRPSFVWVDGDGFRVALRRDQR